MIRIHFGALATARQLFTSTVVPVVDYASNVWMHAFKDRLKGPINRVQRIGAQAIVGTFLTVATSVAEAEACIAPVQDRFWRRIIKLWTDIHTLPDTNPLRRKTSRMRRFRRQFRSPLYEVAEVLKDLAMEELETINPFTLAPWEKRVHTIIDESAADKVDAAVRIAVSCSRRNGLVGIGGATQLATSVRSKPKRRTFYSTIGTQSQQNPYSGELAAMARALSLVPQLRFRRIALLTSNKAAVLSLRRPRQQSGQEYICRIYDFIRHLRREGNTVTVIWTPAHDENKLKKYAKDRARKASGPKSRPPTQRPVMKSTMLSNARAKRGPTRSLPEKVGIHSKKVDTALPGKHTRQLYDKLSWTEANILAQLRTGMTEHLSSPDQGRPDRSMRMRTSERDGRAFPLPMHQMDSIPHGDAPVYRNTPKQHIFLPRREDTDRRQVLDSGPNGSAGYDTVRNSDRTT